MKLFNMMLCGALAFGLWSCSDKDEPIAGGNDKPNGELTDGGFYANLTLSFPTGTGARSATTPQNPDPGTYPNTNSAAGFEIGQDNENNIQSLVVILAKQANAGSYTYLTHAVSGQADATVTDQSKNEKTYTLTFKHSVLEAHAGENGIYVFAIANPGTALLEKFQAADATFDFDEIFKLATADQAPWLDNQFLMTNKIISDQVTLPTVGQFPQYSTKENAFELGTVLIERAAVRFDFRPTTVETEKGANFYPVKASSADDAETVAYIELTDMALFNQAKDFYYFRRVSKNGYTTGDAYAICGREYYDSPSVFNYVVGPNADKFNATYIGAGDFDIHNTGTVTDWEALITGTTGNSSYAESKWTALSSLSKDDDDNNWEIDQTKPDKTGYKIWRYTTENVIPRDPNATGVAGYDYQIKGATTGVVFRGHLRAVKALETGETAENTTNAINFAINSGKPVYQYGKTLYGDEVNLAYTAKNAEKGSLLEVDFDKCFTITYVTKEEAAAGLAEGETYPQDTEDKLYHQVQIKVNGVDTWVDQIKSVALKTGVDKAKLQECGFYVFENNADANLAYAVYYPYYNRHNDNGDNQEMGGMEFGTVRNNVYKLSVTEINSVGKPVYVVDDPKEKDETPEVYFTVTCRILPWVVRVNKIIF